MAGRQIYLLLALLAASPVVAAESVCHGTTAHGNLENGCRLPAEGANFSAYSLLGRMLGRTWLHCTVRDIVVEAYGQMAVALPDTKFVYGETGFAAGGPFKPHRTHQNGLSVDFFVPATDGNGHSVALPTNIFNKWGYNVEFDGHGRDGDLVIDFEALAAHLLALYQAARRHGAGIRLVVFDPRLQPLLHATRAWPQLKGKVRFSSRQAWVRHDEHYHVDFDIPCRPLG